MPASPSAKAKESTSLLPPEVDALTAPQLREFRTVFAPFDVDGTIALAQVPLALAGLALYAPEREFAALCSELHVGSRVDFIAFSRVAARVLAGVNTPDAVARLLGLWDPAGTGTISLDALREAFVLMPKDPLLAEPAQWDSFAAYADSAKDGKINIRSLSERLYVDNAKAVKAAKAALKAAAGGDKTKGTGKGGKKK